MSDATYCDVETGITHVLEMEHFSRSKKYRLYCEPILWPAARDVVTRADTPITCLWCLVGTRR